MHTVLLQAMKEDPPLDAKCRDKFLVQSVAVTADKEFSNVASIVCHPCNISGIKLFTLSAVGAHRTDRQVVNQREKDSSGILTSR